MGKYSVFEDNKPPKVEELAKKTGDELLALRADAERRQANLKRGGRADSGVFWQLGQDLNLIDQAQRLQKPHP